MHKVVLSDGRNTTIRRYHEDKEATTDEEDSSMLADVLAKAIWGYFGSAPERAIDFTADVLASMATDINDHLIWMTEAFMVPQFIFDAAAYSTNEDAPLEAALKRIQKEGREVWYEDEEWCVRDRKTKKPVFDPWNSLASALYDATDWEDERQEKKAKKPADKE